MQDYIYFYLRLHLLFSASLHSVYTIIVNIQKCKTPLHIGEWVKLDSMALFWDWLVHMDIQSSTL